MADIKTLISYENLKYYDEKIKELLQKELELKSDLSDLEALQEIIPTPAETDKNSYLRGDGTWAPIEQVTIDVASADRLGIVKGGNTVGIESDGTLKVIDNEHKHTTDNITDLNDILDGYVPITTTINGQELTGNIVISSEDLGLEKAVILDENGHIPSSVLPSYVDDVVEVSNYSNLPEAGETGKIYVTLDNNKTYRWGGTNYVEISASLALGETSSTAFAGNRGLALETKVGEIENVIADLEDQITNAEGSIKTITINNGEAITPDSNKNINIDLSAFGEAYQVAENSEIDSLFVTGE